MITKLWAACFLLTLGIAHADIGDIAAVNRLKREAETAFQNKYWNVAAAKYKLLVEQYGVREPAVLLNLGHAYFEAKDYRAALAAYEQAAKSSDKSIQTIACQQAAVIKAQNGQLEEALKYLRNSLRARPDNQAARYNYEVVYALFVKKQRQQQQNRQQEGDKNSEEQQNQNRGEREQNAERRPRQGEQSKNNSQSGEEDQQGADKGQTERNADESKLRSKRLEQIKMTEEQARRLLDAIRNNEVQYLQQMQRQPNRRPDRSKPDW